jgi:predicted RNA-binding Zn-ribbon protein involved in translation (DUF1610 family)
MGRRKNVGPQYRDICSNCDKEVPYGDIRNRITVCPDCEKRMIHTGSKCYEVAKLLKEINLKPFSVNDFWMIDKDGVGHIDVVVRLGMPCAEAMFSTLSSFEFISKGDSSALRCKLDNITNETLGVKYLGSYDVLWVLDSCIKNLKNWCEDYRENYEARWAVGKLAGWLD